MAHTHTQRKKKLRGKLKRVKRYTNSVYNDKTSQANELSRDAQAHCVACVVVYFAQWHKSQNETETKDDDEIPTEMKYERAK